MRETSGFKHSGATYRTVNGVRWECVTAGGGSMLITTLRKIGIKYRYIKDTDDVYCHPDDMALVTEIWHEIQKARDVL